MPQLSLTEKPSVDLVIKVHDLIYQGDAAFVVTVQLARLDEPLRTLSVQRYSGVGVDCLRTAVGSVLDAYLHGDGRDVKRAADFVARRARQHAEAYESE